MQGLVLASAEASCGTSSLFSEDEPRQYATTVLFASSQGSSVAMTVPVDNLYALSFPSLNRRYAV